MIYVECDADEASGIVDALRAAHAATQPLRGANAPARRAGRPYDVPLDVGNGRALLRVRDADLSMALAMGATESTAAAYEAAAGTP